MSFVRRTGLISATIVWMALSAAAQEPVPDKPGSRTNADETFQLNIVERRIVETDFAAATAVGFENPPPGHLKMNVGVELRATRIDVTLRNVTGTVRFRGSVQRIIDVINRRPARPPR
jgi:hypothetical protein